MKFFPLALVVFAVAVPAHAQTADLSVIDAYKIEAESLAALADSGAESSALEAGTRSIIEKGTLIMSLYADANPACASQYSTIQNEIASMSAMTVEELDSRYHDGTGLPAAPRHCYFGRSLLVHPAMNLARYADGITSEEREDIVHEFEEVAHHTARVRANIENPPQ